MWRIFGGRKREAELDEELQAHIEIETRRLEVEGLSDAGSACTGAPHVRQPHAGGGTDAGFVGRPMANRTQPGLDVCSALGAPDARLQRGGGAVARVGDRRRDGGVQRGRYRVPAPPAIPCAGPN